MSQKRDKLDSCLSQQTESFNEKAQVVGLWSACWGWHKAAFVAVTNSQSNNSSHGLFTPLLEAAFDLQECAHALALDRTRDGIQRPSGKPVLNLQPVPHYFLE